MTAAVAETEVYGGKGEKSTVKWGWGGVGENDFLLNPNVSLPPSLH